MSDATSAGVVVESLPDGTAVAVKRYRGPDAAEALERETEVLGAAVHEGVPRVIEARGQEARPCLVMELAGTRSLASSPPRSLDSLCAVLSGLCGIVADLHDRGICHGQVELDHVLLRTDRGPVLCGFGAARFSSEQDTRAADVAALGSLMRELLPAHLHLEGAPARTRVKVVGAYRERSLLNLADQAILDDLSARPSARALADAVEAVTTPRSPRRHRPVVAVAGGVLVALLLVRLLGRSPSDADTSAPRPPTISLPPAVSAPPPAPAAADGPAARVVHEGVAYSAGAADDTLIAADVECDGTSSAVMLREADDTLWHFTEWADAESPVRATFVEGAVTSIEVRAGSDGCELILATAADGGEHLVDLTGGGR